MGKPTTSEKPEPAEETPEQKEGNKKLASVTRQWSKRVLEAEGHDEDQEGGETDEGEADEKEVRDYGKARKMSRMLKAGNVPEDVRKLWESADQQSNPRSGNYTMCTTSPDFQSWKANTDTKFSEGYSTGETYSVMLWKVFHGNEQAFTTALNRGDVYERGGLYHTLTVRQGRTKTSTDTQQLSGGCAALTVDQFDTLTSFFSGRPWALQGSQSFDSATNRESGPEALLSSGSSSGQRQLALQDKPAVEVEVKWKVVETNLTEAKQALDRLQRDAQRYVSKVKVLGDNDLSEDLKSVLASLAKSLSVCGDCLTWNEVPGGLSKQNVQKFMQQLGDDTDRANETLEKVKAVVKARAD
ncbi:unnamed protein product [Symbiodinium sp. CCMP2592]|nr:unnamed protein product [Symbiodinium sp. CCMP2592]